jgi:glycosyltransferase involved in cell wall biosynthesis
MRILFLAPDAFGGIGGIAKYNRDLLRALCSAPEVSEVVAVPRRTPLALETLPHRLTYVTAGIKNKLRYFLTVLRLLVNSGRYDVIFCSHINLLPLAYLAKMRLKTPLIVNLHGIDAWRPNDNRLTNLLVPKVDLYLSVSEITKNRFLEWARIENNKVIVLPNSVSHRDFRPDVKNPKLLKRYGLTGKIVLLTLGRLAAKEQYKGVYEVLELLPALAQQIPEIAYLIVGDGDDRERLKTKARSLGVSERIIFAGFIPEEEKADHYRLAEAYVMPGWGEGFGIVYLEAMACGIPVVGSKLDGSREALRGGSLGILVDPRYPDEIKSGILEALRRPRGVIPEGLEYFSYENFEQRCHQILSHVVQRIARQARD